MRPGPLALAEHLGWASWLERPGWGALADLGWPRCLGQASRLGWVGLAAPAVPHVPGALHFSTPPCRSNGFLKNRRVSSGNPPLFLYRLYPAILETTLVATAVPNVPGALLFPNPLGNRRVPTKSSSFFWKLATLLYMLYPAVRSNSRLQVREEN